MKDSTIRSPKTAPRYTCNPPAIIVPMESDQLNLIENALQDLAARASELRRYL
jgi:hypothetical protein